MFAEFAVLLSFVAGGVLSPAALWLIGKLRNKPKLTHAEFIEEGMDVLRNGYRRYCQTMQDVWKKQLELGLDKTSKYKIDYQAMRKDMKNGLDYNHIVQQAATGGYAK